MKLIFLVTSFAALAQAQGMKIKSFSVGPDQALSYPSGPADPPYLNDLSDEHATLIPPTSAGAAYLVFGASSLSGGNSGAVVLQSTDLKTFTFASSLGYNRQVMAAPVPFVQCNPTYQTEFDGNYAAPGSVVQDPTLPPGNVMIIYEAENHCPGGVHNADYYATIGFARSSDNGKTWPAPINGPNGGPARHPVLQNSVPQPTSAHGPLGDAIPSAFVDKNVAGDAYLYAVYENHMADGTPSRLRIARAKLGGDPLTFLKWNNGSFSEPGIGGNDSPFLHTGGCTGAQNMGEISRNDDLGFYVALFVCTGNQIGAWYYSTATSLDLQDWTVPQLIENSQFPSTPACSADGRGQDFDGWYPSSMSPGAPAGHTKLTGRIFFMNGCDTGKRQFMSRTFTITAQSVPLISKVANAEGENATIAANTWVEIKGSNLAPAGDTRIWQSSDFTNNQMPTNLDGVSVTVNGKAAFVYYISPTQINILTSPDALPPSPQVVVTNSGVASAPFTAQAQPISPSFFVLDTQHVAAVHLNGDLVGAVNLSVPGYTFSPAKPGEIIQIYANGFGPTSTPVVSGAVAQGGTLSPLPIIKIGGITATVQFAGLVFPGEFQFNVVVPPNAAGGDQSIVAIYNGVATQAGTVITIAGSNAPTSVTYYVSPSGNDSFTGTLAALNAANTDGPFATFDRARAAVQGLNKNQLTQITVQFRSGTYFLPSTQMLSAADSGSSATPLLYQNYPGESPVFSGGMRVQNWINVSGNTWKTTLPASTQFFENLFYNGVRRLRPRLGGALGTYFRYIGPIYLPGAAPPANPPDPNCSVYFAGSGWKCYDRFQYQPTDPIVSTWKNLSPSAANHCGQPVGNPSLAGDIELVNFEQYSVSKLRLSCIDTVSHVVYLTGVTATEPDHPTSHGFLPNHRYLIENVQDDLTLPGQWFLDRSTTPWTLSYLANPGENPNTDTVIVPQLTQLLVASGLQYVTFQGLTFEHDNYTIPAAGYDGSAEIVAAVSFQNSQHVTVDSSIVSQTSGTALEFISCIDKSSLKWCVSLDKAGVAANNTIQNSAFYDIASDGIRIGTSGNSTDTNANVPQFNSVQNTVVEGYGRVFPGSKGIAQGQGHDNLYTHNDVYDGYKGAIKVCYCANSDLNPPFTNNNIISFNHVYNLFQGIMNDSGSLYFGVGTPSPPQSGTGNRMLNNKVHDVNDASVMDSDGYGGDGLYADDFSGQVDMENNLIYRVSGNAISFSGPRAGPGQSSTVRNNILAFARQSLLNAYNPYSFSSVPPIPMFFTASNNLMYFDRTSSQSFYVQGGCTYAGQAYSAYEQWNSNLFWRTDGAFASDPQAFHVQQNLDQNVVCGTQKTWTYYTFAGWRQFGEDAQSVVQNPGFTNPAYPADDYSLPKGSPGAGFVIFDPNEAGRSNPVINPPPVPATFPTKTFDPRTDF